MAENNLVLTFEVYRGDALIKSAEFTDESITIGSGPAALLTIDDKSLADLHAVVNVEEDGAVQLLDLGSEGGTKVNGETRSPTPTLSTGRQDLQSVTSPFASRITITDHGRLRR